MFRSRLSEIGAQNEIIIRLEQAANKLRNRKFVLRSDIEEDIQNAKEKLPDIQRKSEKIINDSHDGLLREIAEFKRNVMQVSLRGGDPIENERPVELLEQELQKVNRSIAHVGASLDALLSKLIGNLSANQSLITYINFCIDNFDELNFKLNKNEQIVAFSFAKFQNKENKKIPGALFITDKRLLFQRREKVVTKRTWGIFASETREITENILDKPASLIKSISTTVQGIVFDDHIMQLDLEGEQLVFYIFTQAIPKWLYYQIQTLIAGRLNMISNMETETATGTAQVNQIATNATQSISPTLVEPKRAKRVSNRKADQKGSAPRKKTKKTDKD